MIKRAAIFAVACATIIGVGAWGVTAVAGDAIADRAVWVSALVAFVVQVGAFAVVWPIVTRNPIAGWGVGSAIRFVALALYALVGVKLLGLASGAALLSLVGFLFATMLVEPLFLRR